MVPTRIFSSEDQLRKELRRKLSTILFGLERFSNLVQKKCTELHRLDLGYKNLVGIRIHSEEHWVPCYFNSQCI